MEEKLVNSLTNFVIKNRECDDRTIKAIRYGISGLYNSLIKTLVVMIITLFIDTFIEFLLLWLFYAVIRTHSYGLHASSSLICWITTLTIYIGGSLIIKYISLNSYIIYAIWIFAFISFILWAPADTPKRPLIHKEKRKEHKIKTCLITLGMLVLLLLIKNPIVDEAIVTALFIQSLCVNPLIYYITKTPFNNYKTYVKKV